MKYHATRESTKNGQVSLLAVLETIIAVAVSITFAIKYQTTVHIVVGAALAPLLLLKTDYSAHAAKAACDWQFDLIKQFSKKSDRFVKSSSIPEYISGTFLTIILFCWTLIAIPLSWFNGFVVGVATHPIVSAQAIARNWQRSILCTDLTIGPEMIPIPERDWMRDYGKNNVFDMMPFLLQQIRQARGIERLTAIAASISCLLVFAGPTLVLRLSVKSTAIVWFPLLWVVAPMNTALGDLRSRLRFFRQSDLTRLAMVFAGLSIICFVLKFFFLLTWTNFAEWWNTTDLLRFLAIAVQPKEIPIWQCAMLINSALMFFFWLYCGETVKKIDCGVEWSEPRTIVVVRYTLAIRRLLTCYSIACNLYLYAQASPAWNLPPLGTKFVPW